jgi:very-short-patch-repair endonuclease
MESARTNELLGILARAHHGLIRREIAIQEGISHSALTRRVRAHVLEPVGPGVYRFRGAPITWDQKALLGCWEVGPAALVSHRAAGLRWTLDGVNTAPIEVVTDRWTRRTAGQAIVHEANDLVSADRSSIAGLPVTSPLRTVLDLAGVMPVYRVEQAMEDALRRKLFTPKQLGDRFLAYARPGKRGVRALRPLVEERVGGQVPTGSDFELRVARLARHAGLPEPRRQVAVQLPVTRVYLDLAWPERRFAVECDGIFIHGTSISLRWDDDRQNELVLLGWFILRLTWHTVTKDRAHAIDQLRQGWLRCAPPTPA